MFYRVMHKRTLIYNKMPYRIMNEAVFYLIPRVFLFDVG